MSSSESGTKPSPCEPYRSAESGMAMRFVVESWPVWLLMVGSVMVRMTAGEDERVSVLGESEKGEEEERTVSEMGWADVPRTARMARAR